VKQRSIRQWASGSCGGLFPYCDSSPVRRRSASVTQHGGRDGIGDSGRRSIGATPLPFCAFGELTLLGPCRSQLKVGCWLRLTFVDGEPVRDCRLATLEVCTWPGCRGTMSWPRVTELSGDEGNGDSIRREEGVQQGCPLLEHPGHELLRVRFTMCLPVLEITEYNLVPPEDHG
jgi:hypothetical protein